jgi:hypothetical protein
MKLTTAALIAFSLFTILRFPVLSFAKAVWGKHNLVTKRKKGFWIAAIQQAAEACLTAGLTFVALAAMLLVISLQGGASWIPGVRSSSARQMSGRRGLLCFFSSRSSCCGAGAPKQHFVDTLDREVKEKFEEFQQILENRPEDWKHLEPTPAMNAVLHRLQSVLAELEALKSEEPDDARKMAALQQARDQLSNLFIQLDFERRVEISWDLEPPETRAAGASSKRCF